MKCCLIHTALSSYLEFYIWNFPTFKNPIGFICE